MLDLWISADYYDCKFICAIIVIVKHIGFFFHQKSSITYKMHQIYYRPGLRA